MNFFIFDLQQKNQVLNVAFSGDCLLPFSLLTIQQPDSADAVSLLDSDRILIKGSQFGVAELNELKSGEFIEYDLAEEATRNLSRKQQVVFGEGNYKCLLFCPIFKENETNFSFVLKSQKLEIRNFAIQKQNPEEFIKEVGFVYKYNLELESSQIVLIHITDLNGVNNFFLNATQSEMTADYEFEYDGTYTIMR